jgi:hypothetical protein
MKKGIDLKSICVGEAYSSDAGNVGLFLGYVNTETMMVDVLPHVDKFFWYKRDRAKLNTDTNFGVRFLPKKFVSLWMEFNKSQHHDILQSPHRIGVMFHEALRSGELQHFAVKQTYRYKNKLKYFKLDVPNDVIISVRNMANRRAIKTITNNQLFRTNGNITRMQGEQGSPPDKTRHYDAALVQRYAPLANMVPYGMVPVRSEACNIFLPWETRENKFKGKQI